MDYRVYKKHQVDTVNESLTLSVVKSEKRNLRYIRDGKFELTS